MHILSQLTLPDRYESLERHAGSEIARLLTPPSKGNVESLNSLAHEIKTRREGVLVPLYGPTGTGKTTFAMSASQWSPEHYVATCKYEGELTYDGLVHAVEEFAKALPANNGKIIPINIDHRESNPPSDAELSSIKRFLRTNPAKVPSAIFWPETNRKVADDLSHRYEEISGKSSISLPLVCEGPAREMWQEIAKTTLSLCNGVDHLEELGVDPSDYNPNEFRTLGEFMRKISHEFNQQVIRLRQAQEKPVSIAICFVSESAEPGVLAQLTSPSKYGLLNGRALVAVTAQSEIGKWWAARPGLLTRTIVQLDAHALCLPPAAAASIVRNVSDEMSLFDELKYSRSGPARAVRDFGRTDVGKFVCGNELSRFEARGTPSKDGLAAFQMLGEQGFNLGKDKNLNNYMATVIRLALEDSGVEFERIDSEKKLTFCALIPDNSIFFKEHVQCIEYTWRKGQFLGGNNRSEVAQYILNKLRNYARQLEWTSD